MIGPKTVNLPDSDMIDYYMFLTDCLEPQDLDRLKKAYEAAGGYRKMPWWQYVRDHCNINVDASL